MRGLIAVIVMSSVFFLSGQVNAQSTPPNDSSEEFNPDSPECRQIKGCFPTDGKPPAMQGKPAHPKKKHKKKAPPPCQVCPQGEKGDKGDAGERGEKGDEGDVGPQGPQGVCNDCQHKRGPVRFAFGAMGNVMWQTNLTSLAVGPALQLQIDITDNDELTISGEYGPGFDGAIIGEIAYTRYLGGYENLRPLLGLGIGAYFTATALSINDINGYHIGITPQAVIRPNLGWGQLRISFGPYAGVALYSIDGVEDPDYAAVKDTSFSVGFAGSITLSIF